MQLSLVDQEESRLPTAFSEVDRPTIMLHIRQLGWHCGLPEREYTRSRSEGSGETVFEGVKEEKGFLRRI
jgi:hypothetical protein